MKKLLILGAGGHGKCVLDIAKKSKQYNEISFLDDKNIGDYVLGHRIIGDIKSYKDFISKYDDAIVAIGNNEVRLKLTERLIEEGYNLPIIIDPSATISSTSNIGQGTVVMPKATINTCVTIGKACIINSGAIVEHDCNIGDGVHLSPGAILGGTVSIGNCTWICLGAKVINNININDYVTIGAGAVVIDNIEEKNVLVVGVPAK